MTACPVWPWLSPYNVCVTFDPLTIGWNNRKPWWRHPFPIDQGNGEESRWFYCCKTCRRGWSQHNVSICLNSFLEPIALYVHRLALSTSKRRIFGSPIHSIKCIQILSQDNSRLVIKDDWKGTSSTATTNITPMTFDIWARFINMKKSLPKMEIKQF